LALGRAFVRRDGPWKSSLSRNPRSASRRSRGLAAEGNGESAGFVHVVPLSLRASGSHRSPAALAPSDASRAPRSRLVASDQSGSEAVSTRDAQPCALGACPSLQPFSVISGAGWDAQARSRQAAESGPRSTCSSATHPLARGQARSGHRLSLGRRRSVSDGVITSAGTGRLHMVTRTNVRVTSPTIMPGEP
jgi:hypothetical protein